MEVVGGVFVVVFVVVIVVVVAVVVGHCQTKKGDRGERKYR